MVKIEKKIYYRRIFSFSVFLFIYLFYFFFFFFFFFFFWLNISSPVYICVEHEKSFITSDQVTNSANISMEYND